jgi:hypothetical protein
MNKYIIIFFSFLISIVISSCKKNLNSPETIISDKELYSLVYSDYIWPIDFYQEDSLDGIFYYETTSSIKPQGHGSNVLYQLCTNNIDTARNWSELSSNYGPYYMDLVSQKETEKYFEFKRVYSVRPSEFYLSRVHKCSYIDRSMYDLFYRGEILGVFNKNNFNQDDVKELIEYLWFIKHYYLGTKVHLSLTEKNDLHFTHHIYEIKVVYGDWGEKDRISYIKNTFHIKISNGEITHQTELIKQIDGKQN